MTVISDNRKFTTSVALASYNGIKYIGEQLDSIRTQTQPPDEVIITDDNSTDGTYEFCCDYISKHKLKGWNVCRNSQNLGVQKNFRYALSKCTGDYIFTSDQDDIWMPDKIETMVKILNTRSEIKLLVSNFIPLLEKDTKEKDNVYVRFLNHRNDGSIVQVKFSNIYLYVIRPGCTFCFRRELLNNYKILDIPYLFHDGMSLRYAILQDGLYLLNRQLIYYRRHSNNCTVVAGFKYRYDNLTTRINSSKRNADIYRKFLDASDELGVPEHNRKILSRETKFFEKRVTVLEKRNPFSIILFVLMNFRRYSTVRNALGDIYAAVFQRK